MASLFANGSPFTVLSVYVYTWVRVSYTFTGNIWGAFLLNAPICYGCDVWNEFFGGANGNNALRVTMMNRNDKAAN